MSREADWTKGARRALLSCADGGGRFCLHGCCCRAILKTAEQRKEAVFEMELRRGRASDAAALAEIEAACFPAAEAAAAEEIAARLKVYANHFYCCGTARVRWLYRRDDHR